MIRSMTAFGRAKEERGWRDITVEIKSVNNRYFDCAARLPRNLLFAEEALRSKAQERVSRGKLDIFVTLESAASDDVVVRVNEALAGEYRRAVEGVAASFGLESDLTALALCRLPDVMRLEQRDLDAEAVTGAITLLAERALDELDAMRLRESMGGLWQQKTISSLRILREFRRGSTA